MRRLGSFLASFKTTLPVAGVWLLMASHAQAAASASDQEGSWPFVGSYAIALLLITLGLLVVCQGGHRADEPPLVSRFDD